MDKLLYKNIVVYHCGGYSADYNDGRKCFALHASCFPTRKDAYEEAKAIIDYLNKKEVKA